jgi:heat shock protein 4
LEEYVYDMRGKLDDRYVAYVAAGEKEKLIGMLSKAEDWLYSEEGEDATKSAYVSQLDALKAAGDPIVYRYTEHSELPRATSQLREALNQYYSQATSGDEKYSHIDAKDLQAVVEKVAVMQKWLDDSLAKQAEKPKTVNPVISTSEIKKKREEIVYFASPILNKPKPKPPVVPADGATNTPPPASGTGTPQPPPPGGDAADPASGTGTTAEPANMDVD